MFNTKRALAGAFVTAMAVALLLSASPAQAASPGKGADRAAVVQADYRGAPDRSFGAVAAPSPAAASALATIQQRIAEYVAVNGTTYTFGSYLDPATGQIVLDTDAPASLVASLTDLSSAGTAQRLAASEVQVSRATATDLWHRRDDIQSYWGGAGLLYGGFLCSAGYAVQNSSGTRFSVSAGHCYPNGAVVPVESQLRTYGVVSNRRLPTVTGHAADMELLGGQSYAGRVYTGGVTSTTSIPVVSAGSAVVGFADYCHSGRTTGEHCGHTATSTTAQVCTATGCKQPVIAFTGGTLPLGGDSGGAFYVKNASGAWIRGNVIAGGGGTAYAQPWTVITSMLNVTIVTG